MALWQKDTEGNWYEWEWLCPDIGKDPIKEGWVIDSSYIDKKRTIRKTVAIDKEGNEHPIELVKKLPVAISNNNK